MRAPFRRRNRLHACLPGDFNEIEEDATDSAYLRSSLRLVTFDRDRH